MPDLTLEARAEQLTKRITARYAMALNALNSLVAQKQAERGTLEVDIDDLLTDALRTIEAATERRCWEEAAEMIETKLNPEQSTDYERGLRLWFRDEFRRRATGGTP